MSGNETTYARDRGLRAIAKQRYTEAMNTWPQHEPRHERTLLGARLYDSECLRCHLEDVASAEARKAQS
jgi:hypothetical protein